MSSPPTNQTEEDRLDIETYIPMSSPPTNQTEEDRLDIEICAGKCRQPDCCANKIYTSIHDDAQKWKRMDDEKIVANTPLHKAAEVGNTAVAVEILNLMPSLGRKLNKEGLSPLHLAIEKGHSRTVRALLRFDRSLVRVKGREGETPLMLCAGKADEPGYDKLLATLLLTCPESVRDVNNRCETVVHVALRKQNSKAVLILVDWLERRNEIASVLTVRDIDGDTPLHAAARFGCVEGARKLVDRVKVNRLNHERMTPLDVAEQCRSVDVAHVLKASRARKASEIESGVLTTTDYVLSTPPAWPECISRAYFSLTKQLTLDMRAAILVVATVILTATYQGVMQPPGGLYPAPEKNVTAPAPVSAPATASTATTLHLGRYLRRRLADNEEADKDDKHLAGQMVMRQNYYYVFMPSNTFAFALSAVIIIFVVPGSPIFLILHICLLFMCTSYLLALSSISYYTGFSEMLFDMSLYAVVGAYLVKLFYYPLKALLVEKDWWLRRCISVPVANRLTSSGWSSTGLAKLGERMKMQNRLLSMKD